MLREFKCIFPAFVIRMLVGHEPSHFFFFGFSKSFGHVIEYCAVQSYDIFNYVITLAVKSSYL